jgi:hypothetical protein
MCAEFIGMQCCHLCSTEVSVGRMKQERRLEILVCRVVVIMAALGQTILTMVVLRTNRIWGQYIIYPWAGMA